MFLDTGKLTPAQQAVVYMLIGALLMAIILLWSMPLYDKVKGWVSKEAFAALDARPMGSDLKSLNQFICSQDCCSTQYPPSFGMPRDPRVDPAVHSTSNHMCSVFEANKGKGAGCMCATKEIKDFHTSRGTNHP